MTDRTDRKKFIDKTINRLREVVDNLDDFRVATRLATVISCVTKDKRDIDFALEKAREHSHKSSIAEALSIIVKTLAEAGNFDQAREALLEMRGMDSYWVAEARIQLARFSGDEDDIEMAKDAVSKIRSHRMRNEARTDLEMALNGRHHTGGKDTAGALEELASVLSKLEAFEDSHKIPPRASSAKLHFLAQTIIYHIFADMME